MSTDSNDTSYHKFNIKLFIYGFSVTDSLPSSATSGTKRRGRLDDVVAEEMKQMMTAMCASDWRERYKGCTTLSEMTNENLDTVGNNIVKV